MVFQGPKMGFVRYERCYSYNVANTQLKVEQQLLPLHLIRLKVNLEPLLHVLYRKQLSLKIYLPLFASHAAYESPNTLRS